MNRAVARLVRTTVLVVLSVGISVGGITQADSREALVPRGASRANGLQELLDFIYHCRDCDGDREKHYTGSSFPFAGGGIYETLVMELTSGNAATRRVWIATNPASAGASAADVNARGFAAPGWRLTDPTQTIAYLGGVSDSFVSSAAEAFRGGNEGRGGGSFGNNQESLAAVPEPAPIFLLGTILLATFSIARLRFNR